MRDDHYQTMGADQKKIQELERRCHAAEAELARLRKSEHKNSGSPPPPDALHEREETLRAIFETIRSGLILVDAAGTIIYANPRMAEMLGRRIDQVIGSNYVDHTHPSVSDEARANMRRLLRGEIDHVLVERLYRRHDDSTFCGELSGSRLHHADGSLRGLVGIITDITDRKRVEQSLRASEERFRNLVEQAQAGIWTINHEAVTTYVNPRVAAMLGYTMEEMNGRHLFAFMDGDGQARASQLMNRRRQGIAESHEFEFIRKDGNRIRTALSTSPMVDPTGSFQGAIAVVTDITERKRAEEALRESEERFRLLLNDVTMVSVQGYGPDGTTQYWNAGSRRLYGYTAEEALGRSLLDLIIPPEMHDQVAQAVRQMAETGVPVPASELNLKRKDGTRVPVYSSHSIVQRPGHPPELFCIDIDLSAIKQAEVERERLSAAIAQSGEVVVITDTAGKIQYVNPAFESITGYRRDEVIGRNPRILKSGKHDATFYDELWRTISSGRTWQGRFVNNRKDGQQYTEDATISPVRDAAGNIINYVAVKRDITEQLQLAAQFQQAQKMESVGRLAGGVAHDFNNMLTAILGYVELAVDRLPTGDPVRSDLDEIRRAAQRSADLTRQLLAFARRQTVTPQVLNLNDTIAAMLKMLRRLIGEDIELRWIPHDRLPLIHMDPSQIDQLLVNLVVNARDAIAGVGRITIETAPATRNADDCGSDTGPTPGQFVMLAIIDNGCGMDEATRVQIFEPFFTTKGLAEGTGLGLATVYGIVKQNRGCIDVASAPGRGTTFRVYLPVHVVGQPHLKHTTKEAAAIQRGNETILLVEDEPAILALGTQMLQRQGYHVLPASSPGEALRVAQEHAGEIHLLITDVVMPEMNGRELAKRLLTLYPNLKRLFMSGYTADVVAHRGVVDEGINFIQKPFSMQSLATQARQALDT